MSVLAFAVKSATVFFNSGEVASRWGWLKFQYHLDTSLQLDVVEIRTRCRTFSYGGIDGSSNMRGTLVTSQRCTRVWLSPGCVVYCTVPGISSRRTIFFSGLASGACTS